MTDEERGGLTRMESPQHLASAAEALRAILARRDREHSYTVEVLERHRHDAAGLVAAAAGKVEVGAGGDDADTISDRHDATTGRTDDDGGEEAA